MGHRGQTPDRAPHPKRWLPKELTFTQCSDDTDVVGRHEYRDAGIFLTNSSTWFRHPLGSATSACPVADVHAAALSTIQWLPTTPN
ncbi:Hypothetical protein [Corynebacterium glutamicum ATCC 13032]|uniref:Uncharacterized protein n=1 Tax=Corynebacterium glutamicum (strain ATCC 13032 / DSM 20300 / JCM 1318 / BCRC 11384 / CCUG 27702 / LMG 3730 / NBRC 12168 / NCIMB 10025 / NRRL B-2784 / 534) TaxID=196627 RepID=Q8NTQ4_CORGL|nr:Hypothetical protein [Corynebacterium glutamicum ATCC 13032]